MTDAEKQKKILLEKKLDFLVHELLSMICLYLAGKETDLTHQIQLGDLTCSLVNRVLWDTQGIYLRPENISHYAHVDCRITQKPKVLEK